MQPEDKRSPSLIKGQRLTGEDEDKTLRPKSLREFIGQTSLTEKLSISLLAAKSRGETLDHVLFSGPPGLGKTTLAAIIANEMGGRFHSIGAPAISKTGDLARILTLLEDGDTLFIDEIHRLTAQCEEILYPAMEDGCIDFILGEGVASRSVKLPLKKFTLIGATTRSGMLTSPLKARFGIDLKLEFYRPEEMALITQRASELLEMELDDDAVMEVAKRSRMTPRVSNRLVRRIRDYATVANIKKLNAHFVSDCLTKLGVDELGLVEMDRKLLEVMIRRYGGGPVGIKTLSALVDEDERTIEEDHEPFMLRAGLWEKTAQGRMVSREGYRHLKLEELFANPHHATQPPLF